MFNEYLKLNVARGGGVSGIINKKKIHLKVPDEGAPLLLIIKGNCNAEELYQNVNGLCKCSDFYIFNLSMQWLFYDYFY